MTKGLNPWRFLVVAVKEREFIRRCRSFGLAVMTVSDIARITGNAGQGLLTFLYRMQKRGALERLERGKYYLEESPLESLSSSIISPSYISFLYALSLRHLTTQIPRQIVVASLRSRPGVKVGGHLVKFMKMKRSRFFGMERQRVGGQFFATVATAEKAILDSLAYPLHCPTAEAAAAISTGMDGKLLRMDVLAQMALRFGSRSAAKRLGYIAETLGEDLFDTLGPMVNARYDLLDWGLPPKGARNRRWRLVINEAI